MSDDTATLRVPPHSREAEQAVLGSVMLDNAAFDRVADVVTAETFYRHEHRTVWEAISRLVMAGTGADVLTVFEALQRDGKAGEVGGLPYLNDMAQSVPSATSARHYARIVKDRWLERRLIAAADEVAALAFQGGETDPRAKLDHAQTLFARIQADTVRSVPLPIGEVMVRTLDRISDVSAGEAKPGIPTHIPALDRMLNGGLKPGKVVVLAARPSVGKTSFALQLALNIAMLEGEGVLVLSQEMPADEITDRLAANVGRIQYERIQQGTLDDFDWSNLTEAVEKVRQCPIWIDDQPALTLRDIRSKAMHVKRDGLKVLVLDYLQLCASTRKDQNRAAEIGEISRGMKALAKDLGIAVIELSQLNRQVETRDSPEPFMSDLKESGDIEQDADVIAFLWECRQFSDRKIMGLTFGKNRQGKKGRIGLEFQGDFQLWGESQADVTPPSKRQAAREASDAGGTFE